MWRVIRTINYRGSGMLMRSHAKIILFFFQHGLHIVFRVSCCVNFLGFKYFFCIFKRTTLLSQAPWHTGAETSMRGEPVCPFPSSPCSLLVIFAAEREREKIEKKMSRLWGNGIIPCCSWGGAAFPPPAPASPPASHVHLFVKHVPGAVAFLVSFCITITCLLILHSTRKATSFLFYFFNVLSLFLLITILPSRVYLCMLRFVCHIFIYPRVYP